MYGWSKWGGGFKGLVKEELDTWTCQCCAEDQTIDLPSYMVEIWPREFVRVCAKCKNKMIKEKIKKFDDLVALVRSSLQT